MTVKYPTYPDVSDIRRLIAKDWLVKELGFQLLSIQLDTWEIMVQRKMDAILPSMLPDIIEIYDKKLGIQL